MRKTLDSIGELYEIIFVDGGSNDDGWNIIEKEAKIDQHIRGIRLTRHFGKENSIRAGLHAVSARTALIMDSDMQHPPELIPEMIQIWKKKYTRDSGRKDTAVKETTHLNATDSMTSKIIE